MLLCGVSACGAAVTNDDHWPAILIMTTRGREGMGEGGVHTVKDGGAKRSPPSPSLHSTNFNTRREGAPSTPNEQDLLLGGRILPSGWIS